MAIYTWKYPVTLFCHTALVSGRGLVVVWGGQPELPKVSLRFKPSQLLLNCKCHQTASVKTCNFPKITGGFNQVFGQIIPFLAGNNTFGIKKSLAQNNLRNYGGGYEKWSCISSKAPKNLVRTHDTVESSKGQEISDKTWLPLNVLSNPNKNGSLTTESSFWHGHPSPLIWTPLKTHGMNWEGEFARKSRWI